MFSLFALPTQKPNYSMVKPASNDLFTHKQEIIFVLGGPGSGKGTHCQKLSEAYGYRHLSVGDVLRNIINGTRTPRDSKNCDVELIRAAVKRGDLLDDQMILGLLKDEMALYPQATGFLVDGFPRTLGQLQLFEAQMGSCDKVLFFDTSEAIMKARILKRATLENREDDNEITAANRIKIYKEKSLPVINALSAEKPALFKHIDSSGSIEEVWAQVDSAMKHAAPVKLSMRR